MGYGLTQGEGASLDIYLCQIAVKAGLQSS